MVIKVNNGDDITRVNVNGSEIFAVYVGTTPVYGKSGTETFLSNGSFTVPEGVSEINACMCGGGGHAGVGTTSQQATAGGAGSGAFDTLMNVNPGEVLTIVIGAGGIATNPPVASKASTISYSGGTVTAAPGSNAPLDSHAVTLGVNGGGDGGAGLFGSGNRNGTSSSGCGGSFAGGLNNHENHGGGGGGGGFGVGIGTGSGNAAANTGAGGAGGHTNGDFNGTAGGSGKCVLTW